MNKSLLAAAACTLAAASALAQTQHISQHSCSVPINGNAYITQRGSDRVRLGANGTARWHDTATVVSVFFRVSTSGSLCVNMEYTSDDEATLAVACAAMPSRVQHVNFAAAKVPAEVKGLCIDRIDTGYCRIDLHGVKRSGASFPAITKLILSGSAIAGTMNFVSDFSPYWGQRGPSVHLTYTLPKETDFEWFYNELTVPENFDPVGSYFMTNGFGEGYCGMQVNSPSERRVLFSVWSPFSTDNPKDIPDSLQVKCLAKGEGVHVGEFGNEGSGGQSYLIYPWKAGSTYKILTHIRPNGKGATEYSAYFFAPEENRWRLIASFLRPKTSTWYKRPHSFLENFQPTMGYVTRKGIYGNQWARTSDGRWVFIGRTARFTADETARKGARMDYKGGTENGAFFMQNGGFFSDYTAIGSTVNNDAAVMVEPKVDLKMEN